MGKFLWRLVLVALLAAPGFAWGQGSHRQARPGDKTGRRSTRTVRHASDRSRVASIENAARDLDSCHIYEVVRLPGSRHFASHYLEAITPDPAPGADPKILWGLTADLSGAVSAEQRALYISKSVNGGMTWTEVARLGPRYFNAGIGEGERNGLGVDPGGEDFVVTTQNGAFQVFPGPRPQDPIVRRIPGPYITQPDLLVNVPKRLGDPVRAGVVQISPSGKRLILGYGYFDLNPRIYSYHKGADGSWIEDGPLPHIPTHMDILSMKWGDPHKLEPDLLYVGTGDQAYYFNLHTLQWSRIEGVGPDSAIQGISMVRGPHLAACWGVYNPVGYGAVLRAVNAHFLLHRAEDESGPSIRAFDIAVDPLRPNREIVASLTGVYVSGDGGWHWRRLNQLPDGEYRTVHFNPDGTVIVSGIEGAFLANPFAESCSPHLELRAQ